MATKVKCVRCEGTGEVSLSPVMEETLALFAGGRLWTAADIAQKLDIAHSAACNRLTDLKDLGLIERTQKTKMGFGWRRSER